jgi:hypothetical protein
MQGAFRWRLFSPWLRRAVVGNFVGVQEDVAVVLGDWKAFGAMSLPQWEPARAR